MMPAARETPAGNPSRQGALLSAVPAAGRPPRTQERGPNHRASVDRSNKGDDDWRTRVAVVLRSHREARRMETPHNDRFRGIFQELAAVGIILREG
jgi:hypothetical protein